MSVWIRLVPVALLWLSVAQRRRTLRQGPTQRALWLTLATCAVAATMDLPAVTPWLDRLTGAGPNVGHLVKHSAVLAAAAAAREVVRGLAMPVHQAVHRARQRMTVLAAAVAALAVLFALAPVHGTEQAGLTATYATEPLMLAYWVVFLAFLGTALASICRRTFWYSRHAPSGALRTGLSTIGVGAAVGLLYVAHKVLYLLARGGGVTTGPIVESMEAVAAALLALSMVLLVVGVSWPALAEHPLRRRVAAYRAHWALRLLWKDMTEATPAVTLPSGRDIESCLYDRVIEIRDGELALLPYAPGELTDQLRAAAGHLGVRRHLEAAIEAAWLEVARRCKAQGAQPVAGAAPERRVCDDFDGEVRVLIDVARRRRMGARIADRIDLSYCRQNDRAA